jgi:8-oxo-dGTP diphosphatase
VPRASELNAGKTQVAAGILSDTEGRVLITDRSRAKSMRQYWEFPGGKTLGGETTEDALRRELGEELGIKILSCEPFHSLEHDYPGMRVAIDFFLVRQWQGAPSGIEGQALKWLRPEEMSPDTLLPADAPILELLKGRNRD